MTELHAFMTWCAKVSGTETKDTFGRSMRHQRFPYGEVAYWVAQYEQRKP